MVSLQLLREAFGQQEPFHGSYNYLKKCLNFFHSYHKSCGQL